MTTKIAALVSGLGVLALTLALTLALAPPLVPVATATGGDPTLRPAAGPRVTLGLRVHSPPNGEGWGRVAPRRIFNGGAPSGLAQGIRWRRWGSSSGYGRGETYYYGDGHAGTPIPIRLKATRLRRCGDHRAYTVLRFRTPDRPGGTMSRRWQTWTTRMCRPW